MTAPATGCIFCLPDPGLDSRVFYDAAGWFAFLDLMPLTRGHVVLARRTEPDEACPQGLTAESVAGHDVALLAVLRLLRLHYASRAESPKDFLFASLRQQVRHVHTHIVPLWPTEEAAWRVASRHAEGRMWTFLADLDAAMHDRHDHEVPHVRDARQRGLAEEAVRLRILGD